MNKLLYIANVRMPTEKAHGIQIAKMCEAFADAGAEVELILPWRLNRMKGDLFHYYGVKKNFSVKRLLTLDLLWLPFLKPLWFLIQSVSFTKMVWWHGFLTHRWADAAVYTREPWIAAFPPKSKSVMFEIHRLPEKTHWLLARAIKNAGRFVVISEGLKQDLVKMGASERESLVAPDAADLAQFDVNMSQKEAREQVGLPLDKQIVMYTGHLYDWKGVHTLLDAASMCPEKLFVFVGGTTEDAKKFEKKAEEKGAKNILLIKHTAHRNIPRYLKAADLLVLPNSGKEMISARYTSPLKLFEYMAARRPIVASELPSIREILNESTATFFTPDNGQTLTNAINFVFAHAEESAQKADRAFELVKEFTWQKRATRILEFLKAKS